MGVVEEWWSGGVVEWWSGGVVEWWSGGVVEWWSGGVVGWQSQSTDHGRRSAQTRTASTTPPPNHSTTQTLPSSTPHSSRSRSSAIIPPCRGLAIETSGRTGSVAHERGRGRGRGGRVPARAEARGGARADDRPALRGPAWTPGAIEEIYASAGPGSFTGLRVGSRSPRRSRSRRGRARGGAVGRGAGAQLAGGGPARGDRARREGGRSSPPASPATTTAPVARRGTRPPRFARRHARA